MATSQDAPQDISLITGPVNRLGYLTNREQSTILHGQAVWHRLSRDHTWKDWKHVGAALVIGRSGAMREAGVNRSVGRRYKAAFAAWLTKFGFENIDKTDRSRLFATMDHLEAIEAWRATLTPTQRLRLNHPSAVFRKWKSANAISRSLPPPERSQSLRWDPADRPEDIATAMLTKLGLDKAAAVASSILKALEKGKKKLSAELLRPTKSLRSSMHQSRRDAVHNIGGENATSSAAQRPEPARW